MPWNILRGHSKDLGGGFTVRRYLPDLLRQAVGPFLFFDHFGPVAVEPGAGHDVRPHPHIGLATVTYLFSGAIMHRDSLGVVQQIEPGAINWMSAGQGIVHSERKPPGWDERTYVNHGIQLWAALPLALEESAPTFEHTAAQDLPQWVGGDAAQDGELPQWRLLIGKAWGRESPVRAHLGAVYLEVKLPPGSRVELPGDLAAERAVYVVQGQLRGSSQASSSHAPGADVVQISEHEMALLPEGQPVSLSAGVQGAHLMVLGGDPLDAPRHIWWNFVSSRKERIVQAAQAWEAGLMPDVPGETERIPLPPMRFKA